MRTPHATYRAAMHARFRFSDSRAMVCPRVVAGKRCGFLHGQFCLCRRWQQLYGGNVLDHGFIWKFRPREHVLTGEPYGGVSAEALALCRRDLEPLGLVFTMTDESYWFRGTKLWLVHRPGAEHLLFATAHEAVH